ncbi:MAG: Gfo/Idh/MocA family oxidoreductase [Opitutaceae bacterium]|nr:Gfo/Idh/MocA family oxidoreductase [Opitutaceae bacterium]
MKRLRSTPGGSGSSDRTLQRSGFREVDAPDLPYRPSIPRRYRPEIGLIGCGGISKVHLQAYQMDGYEVTALASRRKGAAEERRDAFFPKAEVYSDHKELLARDDIEVVDVATHPFGRDEIIADALRAGKHVLSQKPFVLDLAVGRRLVALAQSRRRLLAVNQNGRWAPYHAYLLAAVRAGLLGGIQTADFAINWDHTWTKGGVFEKIHHLVLFDFGVHWFDLVASLFSDRKVRSVTAHVARSPGQTMRPPMLAHCAVEFESGLATLAFNAHSKHGPREAFNVCGTAGTLRGEGAGVIQVDLLDMYWAGCHARPRLQGAWMPDGFRGAMGELLCAIEEKREPENSAANNLRTLELCFAAMKSADTGRSIRPGTASRASGY